MLPQISIKEAKGKTIEKLLVDDQRIFLVFSDNTFCRLQADNQYGDYVIRSDEPFSYDRYYEGDMIELGIFTQGEYDEYLEDVRVKQKQSQENRERAWLAELKKKYE